MTYEIQSVKRAIQVLNLFTHDNSELSLKQISQELNIHKSSALRIVQTMEMERYILREPIAGKYRLGYRLYELGNMVIPAIELKKESEPILRRLMQKTKETVHLVIHDKGEAYYLNKIDGPRRMQILSKIGSRLPMHCSAMGKVLLAYMDPDELKKFMHEKKLCRLTPNTITDPEVLMGELKCIQKAGYAVDNGEFENGLKCIAAPIRDSSGKVVAAMSISGDAARLNQKKITQFVELIIDSANKLSAKLGYS